jgi:hypothetical protein
MAVLEMRWFPVSGLVVQAAVIMTAPEMASAVQA